MHTRAFTPGHSRLVLYFILVWKWDLFATCAAAAQFYNWFHLSINATFIRENASESRGTQWQRYRRSSREMSAYLTEIELSTRSPTNDTIQLGAQTCQIIWNVLTLWILSSFWESRDNVISVYDAARWSRQLRMLEQVCWLRFSSELFLLSHQQFIAAIIQFQHIYLHYFSVRPQAWFCQWKENIHWSDCIRRQCNDSMLIALQIIKTVPMSRLKQKHEINSIAYAYLRRNRKTSTANTMECKKRIFGWQIMTSSLVFNL